MAPKTTTMKRRPGPKPRALDWAGIEREYRAGQLSAREIGRQFGTDPIAIRRRAKAANWQRDLTQQVRSEAQRRITIDGLTGETDHELVESAAAQATDIQRLHRVDIARLRRIAADLATRLEGILGGQEPAVLVPIMKSGRHVGDRLSFAVLGQHESPSDMLLRLSQALSRLIPLERQAYGLEPRNRQEISDRNDDSPDAASQGAMQSLAERWARRIAQGPSGKNKSDEEIMAAVPPPANGKLASH